MPPGYMLPARRSFGQSWTRPPRQYRHVSHTRAASRATRVPTSGPETPGPSAATSPASSCPGPIPGRCMRGWSPWNACKSLPQMPHARIRTSTSPGPGGVTGKSCMPRTLFSTQIAARPVRGRSGETGASVMGSSESDSAGWRTRARLCVVGRDRKIRARYYTGRCQIDDFVRENPASRRISSV